MWEQSHLSKVSRLVKQPLCLTLLLLVSSTSATLGCCTSQHFSSFCRMYMSVYEIFDNSSESAIYLEKNNVQLVEASQANHQYCINISRAALISGHSTCRSQKFEAFIEVFLHIYLNVNFKSSYPLLQTWLDSFFSLMLFSGE